jgi:hypothetical protein
MYCKEVAKKFAALMESTFAKFCHSTLLNPLPHNLFPQVSFNIILLSISYLPMFSSLVDFRIVLCFSSPTSMLNFPSIPFTLFIYFLGSTAQLRPWPPPQNPAEFLGGFSTIFFFTG